MTQHFSNFFVFQKPENVFVVFPPIENQEIEDFLPQSVSSLDTQSINATYNDLQLMKSLRNVRPRIYLK